MAARSNSLHRRRLPTGRKIRKPKNHTNKNNVIKQSDRKKNKIKVAMFNKESSLHMNVSELNSQSMSPIKQKQDSLRKGSSLSAHDLLNDQKKDIEANNRIQTEKKQVNDDMLRQIEMISGFKF
ncbi:Adf1p NDAI_0A00160 [Naumovozyma dairenensis CBS 421]|uniref:Antisense of depressing factor protein 1 n=1 Tax=Naumovozyma dairenensis (strain ATCC 10597 / BCRC 20456 / CBS 421 / NBRC 0211 / NRRL Y-12639) TaxID=1071378 RepID=G0W5G2_NAUDC|nr:hypothetical protein NDAI_0A00160 [Naumovozyma dairenensis CBS 421]CCD22176.1 hypothetical protein NDAI_0A00160 [Naumovozyma dairenensis CBS 421]